MLPGEYLGLVGKKAIFLFDFMYVIRSQPVIVRFRAKARIGARVRVRVRVRVYYEVRRNIPFRVASRQDGRDGATAPQRPRLRRHLRRCVWAWGKN